MSEDPGVAWMLAFQAGDDEAFTRLLEHYQGAVFSMLRRILGSEAVLEDLAQEAFLRVWRSRDRYRPQAKFTTFLYRISYNLALNQLRKNKRKRLYSMPTTAEGGTMEAEETLASGPTPAPEVAADAGNWGVLIQQALQELPENQRAAVVFQHYDGLELHEIGVILGISPQATKSLVHRARTNLRTLLTPYREAEHD